MSKYNISKQVKELIKIIYQDLAFHQREEARINHQLDELIFQELARYGVQNRKIKSVDVSTGVIEVGDIIEAKEVSKGLITNGK